MGQGGQMVYCGTKHRQNERQSLTGLCREYTLTPLFVALLYVALFLRLLSPHRSALCRWVSWVVFWCQGIGLDRNGDRQAVGVSLVPLHSPATAEQVTASALVRNDRFDSHLNHFDRFGQGQEP